jgi:hypothetical protein
VKKKLVAKLFHNTDAENVNTVVKGIRESL